MIPSLYRPNVNPARSLYRYWLSILGPGGFVPSEIKGTSPGRDFFPLFTHSINFGGNQYERLGTVDLADDGRPVLGLGYGWSANLVIAPDGRFRVRLHRGWNERRIPQKCFLDYTWTASRLRWRVRTDSSPSWVGSDMIDEARTHYVSDHVLRMPLWWTLERAGDTWHIVPARNQRHPNSERRGPEDTESWLAAYANDQRLRLRRQRLAIARARKRAGLAVSEAAVSVRFGGTKIDRDAAADLLVAALEVSTPTASTPLRRPRPMEARTEEEQSAHDHVATPQPATTPVPAHQR